MEKEFVPYELAVKLISLGFNEPCFGRYWFNNGIHKLNEEKLFIIKSCYFELPEYYTLAPTYSQAFRWFRDKHNLFSHIELFTNGDNIEMYEFVMYSTQFNPLDSKDYFKYEEAEYACLEKLIGIVESKSE